MAEGIASHPTERGPIRKVVDKATLGLSLVTLPLGIVTGVRALWAGNYMMATLAGGSTFMDFTQIKEHNRPPEKQSFYNPERIMDKVFSMVRGRNRFSSSTSRMVHATI